MVTSAPAASASPSPTAQPASTPSASSEPLTVAPASPLTVTAAPSAVARPATAQGTWEAAVRAMLADDREGFRALSSDYVLDKLLTVHGTTEDGSAYTDWEVINGTSDSPAEPKGATILAGTCVQGLDPDHALLDLQGDPSVTCAVAFDFPDASPLRDTEMAYFCLEQRTDSTWAIVDHVPRYI